MGDLVICTFDEYMASPERAKANTHFLLLNANPPQSNNLAANVSILTQTTPCVRPFLQPQQDVLEWVLQHSPFEHITLSDAHAAGYLLLCYLLTRDQLDDCEVTLSPSGHPVSFDGRKGRHIREALSLRYMQQRMSLLVEQLARARQEAVNERPEQADVCLIMTHFNRPHYVHQMLTSIAAQTLKPAQLIVVDDNSEAAHFSTLKQHLETTCGQAGIKYTLLKNTRNCGPSESRNLALTRAHNRFVLFVDDDDVLEPEAIRTLLLAQSRTQADFVSFAYRYFVSEKAPSKDFPAQVIHFQGPDDLASAITYNCVGGISVLFDTALVKELYFHGTHETGEEDWRFALSALAKGAKGTYCPVPLLWYRNVPSSLSKRMDKPISRAGINAHMQSLLPPAFADMPAYINCLQQEVNQNAQQDIGAFLLYLGTQQETLSKHPVVIYGAGEYGKQIANALSASGMGDNIVAFVDRNASGSSTLLGKPVKGPRQLDIQEEPILIVSTFSVKNVNELDVPITPKVSYLLHSFYAD